MLKKYNRIPGKYWGIDAGFSTFKIKPMDMLRSILLLLSFVPIFAMHAQP